MATVEGKHKEIVNGAAVASFLAAGIGVFALGFIVILNETKLFVAPTLYAPVGGLSGRTTLAAGIWLIGWAVLHNRWKDRQIESRGVHVLSLILIGAGIVLTLPPIWKLF